MADVFISYSRRDSDFVRRLHAALSAQQRDVWVDWEDIPLTANWWREICAAIEAANTFIFIISPDSVTSEVCRNEVEHAVQNNKRFIPLLYRDISGVDKSVIHRAIQAHNWIPFNAEGFDSALPLLLNALTLDLEHVRQHTLLLVRAKEWESRSRSADYLLTGAEVGEYDRWLQGGREKEPKPTELQLDYILASQAARSRRQLRFLGGMLAVLVALLALSLVVFTQNQTLSVLNAQATVNAGERTRVAQESTIAAQGTQQSLVQQEATRAARSTQSSLELAQLNATIFAQATQRGIERTQQAATSAAQETRVAQSAANVISDAERLILTATLQAERAAATAGAATAAAQQTEMVLLLAQGQATAYAARQTIEAADARQAESEEHLAHARATAAAALAQQTALAAENAALLNQLNATSVAQAATPTMVISGVERTATATPTAVPTVTPSPSATATATLTATATAAATLTATAAPSATASATLAVPPSAPGQWFVGPYGSDTNACRSAAAACRTINAALALAEPGAVIHLAAGVYSERLRLAYPVTLAGVSRQAVVISGSGGSVITTAATARAAITGLTITGGSAASDGGGILNYGDLTLDDVRVSGNIATGSGGGIANFGALAVANSALEDNYAALGGAIFNAAGAALTVDEATVTFSGNSDAASPDTPVDQQAAAGAACPALARAALDIASAACGALAPGQVCIASPLVEAEPADASLDAADPLGLDALRLSPLERASGTWGVALVGTAGADGGAPGLLVAFGPARAPDPAWPVGQPALVNTPRDTLNLREGPGLARARVAEMAHETRATIIGGPQTADGFTWWRIRLADGTSGWAADQVEGTRTLIVTGAEPITIGDTLSVVAQSLNLRARPGVRSQQVVTLVRGTDLLVLEGPLNDSGLTWWRARAPQGEEGWVAEAVDGEQTVAAQQRGPRAGGADAYLFPAEAGATCLPVPLDGAAIVPGLRAAPDGDRLVFK